MVAHGLLNGHLRHLTMCLMRRPLRLEEELIPIPLGFHGTAPASDGGADITGYELQVRTVDAMFMTGADPPVENTGNSLISSLPANRKMHEHHGVRTGVKYFYRIRAINSAGKSEWSDASDEDGISTETAAAGTPDPADGPRYLHL